MMAGVMLFLDLWPATAREGEKERLLKRYEAQFLYLDSLIFNATEHPLRESGEAFSSGEGMLPVEDPALEEALAGKERADLAAENGATGVHLMLDSYFRFNQGDGEVRDDDGVPTGYRLKYSGTLSWSPLRSGLFRRGIRSRMAALDREIASVSARKPLVQQAILAMKEQIDSVYDAVLCGVLDLHLSNLVLLEQTEVLLLTTEQSTSDEMFRVLEERAATERQLARIPAAVSREPLLQAAESWTPLRIDGAALLECYRETNDDLRLYDLRDSLLSQESSRTDYWQQMEVEPYVRFAAYARGHGSSTANYDAGVTLRLPLSFENGRKRRAIRAEQQVVRVEREQSVRFGEAAIRRILGRSEELTESLIAERTRLASYRELLRLRGRAYADRRGEYSRPARLREYNIYLSSLERFLALQREQELLLVELQGFLPETEVGEFIFYPKAEPPGR